MEPIGGLVMEFYESADPNGIADEDEEDGD